MTSIDTSYISQSQRTGRPTSSDPLLPVNQNVIVISGLTIASKTSVTGLRMSMPVSDIGTRVSWRVSE
jgi:hypothetical protein